MTDQNAYNTSSSDFRIISPESRGMEKFLSFLIDQMPADKVRFAENAIRLWNDIHGNKIIENPTEDYQVLFRTYRGMAAITSRGEVKTTEIVRFENYDRFTRDLDEREYTMAEIKWSNQGTFLTNASRKYASSPSISMGTVFDSDGSAQTARIDHAMRAMTFILNREMRYDMSEIGFLSVNAGGSPDSDDLKRMTPEAEQQFREAYLEDLENYRQLRSNFISRLNAETMSILELAGENTTKSYNWMMGFDVADEVRNEIAENRQIAAGRYPLCIEMLRDLTDTDIQDALNYSGDIEEALAKRIQTPVDNLKNFEGICPEDLGIKGVASFYEAANFIRHATLPPGIADMPVEERRSFVRSTFLITKLEAAINVGSGNNPEDENAISSLRFVTGTTPLPSEEDIKRAIENSRYVSAWLYTTINMPCAALAGENGNSYSRMPPFMSVLTSGQDVSTAVSVINSIADNMARDKGDLLRRHPSRRPSIDMEWASMFRDDARRLPNGTVCRVLTSKSEMDAAFSRTGYFIATAYGVAFETTRQYVQITNNKNKTLGIVTVSPEKIVKGIVPQNRDGYIHGVDGISFTKGLSEEERDEMMDNVIEMKRFILNSPEAIQQAYIESEQQSRKALMAEHFRAPPPITKARLYCPGMDISDEALMGAVRTMRRVLPQALLGANDRDELVRASKAHLECQAEAIRNEQEFRNRSQIHGENGNQPRPSDMESF